MEVLTPGTELPAPGCVALFYWYRCRRTRIERARGASSRARGDAVALRWLRRDAVALRWLRRSLEGGFGSLFKADAGGRGCYMHILEGMRKGCGLEGMRIMSCRSSLAGMEEELKGIRAVDRRGGEVGMRRGRWFLSKPRNQQSGSFFRTRPLQGSSSTRERRRRSRRSRRSKRSE